MLAWAVCFCCFLCAPRGETCLLFKKKSDHISKVLWQLLCCYQSHSQKWQNAWMSCNLSMLGTNTWENAVIWRSGAWHPGSSMFSTIGWLFQPNLSLCFAPTVPCGCFLSAWNHCETVRLTVCEPELVLLRSHFLLGEAVCLFQIWARVKPKMWAL